MVYKSVDHGKLWSIRFFTKTYIYQNQNIRHCWTCYLKHHLETARDPSAIVSFDYKEDKAHF